VQCSPSVPQLYNNLCVLFRNMKKFDDSRKAAAQCLAALPQYAPALNNLALLQVTLGQLTDADDNLRAAMEADHGLSCAQSNAASLQVLRRAASRSRAAFERALVGQCSRPSCCVLTCSVVSAARSRPFPCLQKLRQGELQRIQNLGGGITFS
jgi:hypothetical protein